MEYNFDTMASILDHLEPIPLPRGCFSTKPLELDDDHFQILCNILFDEQLPVLNSDTLKDDVEAPIQKTQAPVILSQTSHMTNTKKTAQSFTRESIPTVSKTKVKTQTPTQFPTKKNCVVQKFKVDGFTTRLNQRRGPYRHSAFSTYENPSRRRGSSSQASVNIFE